MILFSLHTMHRRAAKRKRGAARSVYHAPGDVPHRCPLSSAVPQAHPHSFPPRGHHSRWPPGRGNRASGSAALALVPGDKPLDHGVIGAPGEHATPMRTLHDPDLVLTVRAKLYRACRVTEVESLGE